jgi:hypothetical protein
MMKRFFFLAFLAISIGAVKGYTQPADSSKLAYIKTINSRAGKIVAELGINDSSKFNRVKKIIADQYFNLNDIYTFRDEQKKNANTQLNADKEGLKKELARIDQQSELKVKALHPTFLSKLSTELTPDQIDKVKDGMTYNVVHVTFNGYNQMILNLTEARKKQIMDWLIEAREHAMDAESSDKKHAWFGKYKGRINNYLSAAGYDLKREGEEWEKRRKAEKGN